VTSPRIRGYTLKRITVPGNLVQACDEFNAGKYYECHETLEEIWQEEQGEVRDLYKGLIQVAAAFVHISRGGFKGANRLLATSVGYLAPYRETGAMGFDVNAICSAAESAHRRILAQGPGAVVLEPDMAPVFDVDLSLLAAEARRWRAWGFALDGAVLEMEIHVPD
jgi:hypothetical protein